MRGHLRKRGDRRWAVIVDVGPDPSTGRRRQRWISVRGARKDAERKLAEVITDLETGSYVEPTKISLGDYLRRWLRD